MKKKLTNSKPLKEFKEEYESQNTGERIRTVTFKVSKEEFSFLENSSNGNISEYIRNKIFKEGTLATRLETIERIVLETLKSSSISKEVLKQTFVTGETLAEENPENKKLYSEIVSSVRSYVNDGF